MASGKLARSPEEILKNNNFSFQSHIVRRFMQDAQYVDFVRAYAESRHANRYSRPPSGAELKAFAAYEKGLIGKWDFAKKLGLTNTTQINTKIGRLYAWARENNKQK